MCRLPSCTTTRGRPRFLTPIKLLVLFFLFFYVLFAHPPPSLPSPAISPLFPCGAALCHGQPLVLALLFRRLQHLWTDPRTPIQDVCALVPMGFLHAVSHLTVVLGLGAGAVSFLQTVKASEACFTALLSYLFLGQVRRHNTQKRAPFESFSPRPLHARSLYARREVVRARRECFFLLLSVCPVRHVILSFSGMGCLLFDFNRLLKTVLAWYQFPIALCCRDRCFRKMKQFAKEGNQVRADSGIFLPRGQARTYPLRQGRRLDSSRIRFDVKDPSLLSVPVPIAKLTSMRISPGPHPPFHPSLLQCHRRLDAPVARVPDAAARRGGCRAYLLRARAPLQVRGSTELRRDCRVRGRWPRPAIGH